MPRKWTPHWSAYVAEVAGTATLVFLGVSVVIFDFEPSGLPMHILGDGWLLRAATGCLFGGTGALIALSPLGRISGAHLDPAVSTAFWLSGSLGGADTVCYAVSQFLGGILGALGLSLVWGRSGEAVSFGMTFPSPHLSPLWAVAGEAGVTFALVGGILAFVGNERLRPYTPAILPPLVALLVAFEAPLSGTSMNPARSLGPAIVAHALGVMWVYLLGPAIGAVAAVLVFVESERVYVAKIAHHGFDPFDRFHGTAQRNRS